MHWGRQFGLNFLVAGVIVGGISTLVQNRQTKAGGFVYGVVPFTFLYLYFYTWSVAGADQVPLFAWNAALGGVFWLLFVSLAGYLTYYAEYSNLGGLGLATLLTGLLLASYSHIR